MTPGINVPFATNEAGETLEMVCLSETHKTVSLEQLVIHGAPPMTKMSAEMMNLVGGGGRLAELRLRTKYWEMTTRPPFPLAMNFHDPSSFRSH